MDIIFDTNSSLNSLAPSTLSFPSNLDEEVTASVFDTVKQSLQDEEDAESWIQEYLRIPIPLNDPLEPKQIMSEILEELGVRVPEHFEKIEQICGSSDPLEDISKVLLNYSEYIRKFGEERAANIISEYALKSSLLSILVSVSSEDIKEMALAKIEELQSFDCHMSCYYPEKIREWSLWKLLKNYFPKLTPNHRIEWEIPILKDALQMYLEKKRFNSTYETRLEANSSFYTWVKVDDEGIRITCYPKTSKFEPSSQGCELFWPQGKEEPIIERCEMFQRSDEQIRVSKEARKLLLLDLPELASYLLPETLLIFPSAPVIAKKELGYESLHNLKQENSAAFKTLSLLQTCQDALAITKILEQRNFIGPLHPEDCVASQTGELKLGNEGRLRSLSSEGSFVEEERVNFLAKKGFVSLDTGRYGLILFICERLFLTVDQDLMINSVEWNEEFIKRFNPKGFAICHSLISQMAKKQADWEPWALRMLETRHKMAKKQKPYEVPALHEWILRVALFPVLKKLLLKTLEIEKTHETLFAQGESSESILSKHPMPSLEEIQSVLEEGCAKVREKIELLEKHAGAV